jgi:XTP/dITP diphosphohydrolase
MADFPRRFDQLVLASSNPGKLRELSAMLQPLGVTVRTQGEWAIEDAVEDGLTFVENALIKARHASRHTGLPALGDDSGLVVDALQGKPGIYSSRYAGPLADDQANNRKLLAALQDVPAENRSAHFYCAMAWLRHAEDPAPLIAIGSWPGFILDGQRGKGGFGYDPLFWLPSEECTSAELAAEDKNRLSHRGQALSKLVASMKSEFGNSESGGR